MTDLGAELWVRHVPHLWRQGAAVNQLVFLLEGTAAVIIDGEHVGVVSAPESLWWPDVVPLGSASPATVTRLGPCRVRVLTPSEVRALRGT